MATAINGVIPPGRRAPSFTLPLLEGGDVTVPGSPGLTLVMFFKNSCPTCRLAFPFVQRIHEQVAPRGARVVAVSQDDVEASRSFSRELSLTLPIAIDGEGWPVSREYDLVFVPTFYLIDGDGVIARSLAGFGRDELQGIAGDLAASTGAPPAVLYRPGETVPAMKPG